MPKAANIELLERLVATPGVPGREHRVRDIVLEELDGLADHVEVDAMGSVIAVREPRQAVKTGKKKKGASRKKTTAPKGEPARIMLAAHMDQIGFLVSHIDDRGFCYLNPVGGFDPRNLFARKVTVCPDPADPSLDLVGVMNPGGKPIHVASPEERRKVPTVREFTVDLGLPADKVKKKVRIGDMVVIRTEPERLGDRFVSQALDNRVAVWTAIEALRALDATGHACEVVAVFTVQEEVGLRGAITSAFAVEPTVGIGIDTTLAIDTPGVPPQDACTKLGEGAAITVMDGSSIGDLDLVETFDKLAKRKRIKAQRSVLAAGGTDTAGIQRSRGGVKSMTLSIPTRYIHTITEMIDLNDLGAARDLLAAYLAQA
ncbi:MAG: M20/M25/M40 family metallo-hydrolase [Planctomycetota bacterium]